MVSEPHAVEVGSSNLSSNLLGDHLQVVVAQDLEEYTSDDGFKVRFIRVVVNNVEPAVKSIIESIADTSWVVGLVDDLVKQSFLACAKPTINKLSQDLTSAIDNSTTNEIGEYVVSVVARHIIEATYNYRALPLAEIIKEKVLGNPGFDYHHESGGFVLLFGEAKYKTGVNAYNSALKQVAGFIKSGKDMKEVAVLDYFLSSDTKTNLANGKKGYSAAFSTKNKSFDSQILINNIKNNTYFNELLKHEELLIVAVDVND